jgi:enoyl-CoA hydratase/carnithine racemase
MVVASATARFGLPEVRIGVVPTCGALFRAPHALPLNLANELILTGRPIDAARAHAAGFVNVVTEPGGALAGALELASAVCANAPLSVQACLAAVRDVVGAEDTAGWAATERAKAVLESEDTREGVRSFLERRPPQWTGR